MSDRLTTRKSPRLPTANGWRQGQEELDLRLECGGETDATADLASPEDDDHGEGPLIRLLTTEGGRNGRVAEQQFRSGKGQRLVVLGGHRVTGFG